MAHTRRARFRLKFTGSLNPDNCRRLSAFTGSQQFVIFDFKGADKFTLVKDLAELFQRLIGSTLSWFVLRDREASVPRVLEHIHQEALSRGIENFHIWNRYSIENYLLERSNVIAAVRKESAARSVSVPADERILELLEIAATKTLQETRTMFITETQNYFIRHQLENQSVRERATQAALEYLDGCTSLDAKLQVLPGFKIYGDFVQELQNACGITLRFETLIESLEINSAPTELKDVLSRIENLAPAANGGDRSHSSGATRRRQRPNPT